MELSAYQKAVLGFVIERLDVESEIDTLEFSLSGEFEGKYRAIYARLEGASLGSVVTTVPTYSDTVFVGISSGSPRECARLLANLEDYEREGSVALEPGDFVRTPDPSHDVEIYGVVLLRTASLADIEGLPDCETICGRHTRFHFVVPVSEAEAAMRSQQGHDALMEHFAAFSKDVRLL